MNYLMQHTTITHSRALIILNVFRFLYTIFSRNISLHQNPMLACPWNSVHFNASIFNKDGKISEHYVCMHVYTCGFVVYKFSFDKKERRNIVIKTRANKNIGNFHAVPGS